MGPLLTAAIFFLLGFGSATIVGIIIAIKEEQAVSPEDIERCFPVVEGVVSVNIQADGWPDKRCASDCTDSDRVPECFCFVLILLDLKEAVKFPMIDPSKGGKSHHELKFRRFRQDPIKKLHIRTVEGTASFAMNPFNADLISENKLCETIVRHNGQVVDRCTTITLQKLKERGLKVRSCAKREWLKMWDFDDLE